jgi:hypothetical protein
LPAAAGAMAAGAATLLRPGIRPSAAVPTESAAPNPAWRRRSLPAQHRRSRSAQRVRPAACRSPQVQPAVGQHQERVRLRPWVRRPKQDGDPQRRTRRTDRRAPQVAPASPTARGRAAGVRPGSNAASADRSGAADPRWPARCAPRSSPHRCAARPRHAAPGCRCRRPDGASDGRPGPRRRPAHRTRAPVPLLRIPRGSRPHPPPSPLARTVRRWRRRPSGPWRGGVRARRGAIPPPAPRAGDAGPAAARRRNRRASATRRRVCGGVGPRACGPAEPGAAPTLRRSCSAVGHGGPVPRRTRHAADPSRAAGCRLCRCRTVRRPPPRAPG